VSAVRDIIEVNKELVPYSFNILLADEWFELYIDYNKTADMFTAALYKDDELVASELIVMGRTLFADVYQPGTFPAVEIIPQAPNGVEETVNFENLGETVFLTIEDEGGDADE